MLSSGTGADGTLLNGSLVAFAFDVDDDIVGRHLADDLVATEGLGVQARWWRRSDVRYRCRWPLRRHRLVRSVGLEHIYVGHPSESAPVEGLDDRLTDPVVAHQLPHRLDATGERRLAHEPVAPYLVEQLVLGGLGPVAQQGEQHAEGRRHGLPTMGLEP